MKRVLLSLLLLAFTLNALAQQINPSPYPCVATFDVQNQGNNACGDVQGFKKTGLVEVIFSGVIPLGVDAPTVLGIYDVSDMGFQYPKDVKFTFKEFKNGSRQVAYYCYYTLTGKNELFNGSGTLYKMRIEYANYDVATCDATNAPPSTLPVTFSNFHAQRNRQEVALKWETVSEQNNRGFNVQRNTRGVWETVAFVFSQADGGNSDELLSYEFKDANSEKGVSQYRIQQVDLDGRASYSAIRSVKGLEQAGTRTVVYPNPSSDGKVSVVFEDQGAKAVTVSDLSGRVIRQFRNVLNNVQIEGLESGMYSIQITDLSSAVSSTEKVIIKKR